MQVDIDQGMSFDEALEYKADTDAAMQAMDRAPFSGFYQLPKVHYKVAGRRECCFLGGMMHAPLAASPGF